MAKKKTKPKKKKHHFIYILLVVFVVAIFIVNYYYTASKEKPIFKEEIKGEEKPSEISGEVSFSGEQAAEKIEIFLSSMKKEDNFYDFIKYCRGEKSGPELVQSNNWALMAYSALYNKDKKQEYVKEISSNWDVSAQDDTSADLSTSYQLYKFYEKTADHEGLIGTMDRKALGKIIRSAGSSIITGYAPNDDMVIIIATMSRASFLSAKMIEDNGGTVPRGLLDNADFLLKLAEEKEPKEKVALLKKGEKLYEGSCWIKLAQLQKSEYFNDDKLVEEVSDYFDVLALREEFNTPAILDKSLPMDLLSCAEALTILHDKTGEYRYIEDATAIIGAYLKYNWDIEGRQFCDADGGILSKRIYHNNPETIANKVFTDNTYIAYLLTHDEIYNHVFSWVE